MKICKRCNTVKSDSHFTPSRAAYRSPRSGRVCNECKKVAYRAERDIRNAKERERNKQLRIQRLLNEFGTANPISIKNTRRLRHNAKKRMQYHAGYKTKQMEHVKSWISRNRDKHAIYVKNWQEKQKEKAG